MMRSTTRKKRLLFSLANTVRRLELAGPYDVVALSLGQLPVAARNEAEKKALLRSLSVAERASVALTRMVREIASQLATLPIEEAPVK